MKHVLAILLLSSFFLSGCRSGKSVADKYYLISFDHLLAERQADVDQTLSKSCYLSPVWVHPAFSSHQIAIRSNTHEIAYFSFNEWAIRPAAAFEELLKDFFDANAVFQQHTFSEGIPFSDLRMDTRVLRLEVMEVGKNIVAQLQLEFLLFDQMSNELLLRFPFEEQRSLDTKNLNEFAAVTGTLFTQALFDFSQKVLSTFIEE